MAQIVINEISQNYTYNIGTSRFATVALPIAASWGPAFMDSAASGLSDAQMLEDITWLRFPATQAGLEAFVGTYRGPSANYRLAKDYSYQIAMTLLTAGYDVLTCRVCPGAMAEGTFSTDTEANSFHIKAKYPGTFGNVLQVALSKVPNTNYWNLITYVVDSAGTLTAVENLIFVFELSHATDTILQISELKSNYLTFAVNGNITDTTIFNENQVTLTGGADKAADTTVQEMLADAVTLATERYTSVGYSANDCQYITALSGISTDTTDMTRASTLKYNEWLYTAATKVYGLLNDKLSYDHNRVISPGWDDQNISEFTDENVQRLSQISPIHIILMNSAYNSRCATALLDIPICLTRTGVYNTDATSLGYAQLLSRYAPNTTINDSVSLYQTHSALFAPWGQYKYVGTSKQSIASPAFQALMLQRAMLLNQTIQYEWALPTNRKTNLKLGKLAYTIPKSILDQWQRSEGVGVNAITAVPDLGVTIWGNSTLYEVPPAVYQALANLSTRYLVNAIEDVIFRCGIGITFHYNNQQAYSDFYAGVSPILDTMKNVGAIEDYVIQMSSDIDAFGSVNANTVIGKIFLKINGVINDIKIDLVALPPNADLASFS